MKDNNFKDRNKMKLGKNTP